LYRIDIGAPAAIEFVLDDFEETAMQPLNQSQGFEIERTGGIEAPCTLGGLHHFCDCLDHDAFLSVVVLMIARPCAPARRPTYAAGSKIGLSNTLKIRFIRNGERSIDAVMTGISVASVTSRSRCGATDARGPDRIFKARAGNE